jgi:hypothetical protein
VRGAIIRTIRVFPNFFFFYFLRKKFADNIFQCKLAGNFKTCQGESPRKILLIILRGIEEGTIGLPQNQCRQEKHHEFWRGLTHQNFWGVLRDLPPFLWGVVWCIQVKASLFRKKKNSVNLWSYWNRFWCSKQIVNCKTWSFSKFVVLIENLVFFCVWSFFWSVE